MLNLVFETGLTYQRLCKKSKKLWDEYVQSPPDNPSVSWGRWKEEATLAREHLSSVDFGNWPVSLICECQLVLRPYLEGRSMMHMLYKVVRASDDQQLWQDFRAYDPTKHTVRIHHKLTYDENQVSILQDMKAIIEDYTHGNPDKDFNVDEILNTDKETLLFVAARDGGIAAVEHLLKLGADVSKSSGHHRRTALYIAAKNGHREVFEILLLGRGVR